MLNLILIILRTETSKKKRSSFLYTTFFLENDIFSIVLSQLYCCIFIFVMVALILYSVFFFFFEWLVSFHCADSYWNVSISNNIFEVIMQKVEEMLDTMMKKCIVVSDSCRCDYVGMRTSHPMKKWIIKKSPSETERFGTAHWASVRQRRSHVFT